MILEKAITRRNSTLLSHPFGSLSLFGVIFVSPAKQKRDICIAFPVLSSSASAAASAKTFVKFLHFLRNYKG